MCDSHDSFNGAPAKVRRVQKNGSRMFKKAASFKSFDRKSEFEGQYGRLDLSSRKVVESNPSLSSIVSKSSDCDMCIRDDRYKLRLRNVRQNPPENLRMVVLDVFDKTMHLKLSISDVVHCERLPQLDGSVAPGDIIVTFTSATVRDEVFKMRDKLLIVEELGDEIAEEQSRDDHGGARPKITAVQRSVSKKSVGVNTEEADSKIILKQTSDSNKQLINTFTRKIVKFRVFRKSIDEITEEPGYRSPSRGKMLQQTPAGSKLLFPWRNIIAKKMREFRIFLKGKSIRSSKVSSSRNEFAEIMHASSEDEMDSEPMTASVFPRTAFNSFAYTEWEKYQNKFKLRLRFVDQDPDENLKERVLQLLRDSLGLHLKESDITYCKRVSQWNGEVEPDDILVCFSSAEVRNDVYVMRYAFNNGIYLINDELGRERVNIWNKAKRIFGDLNVYTENGAVAIDHESKTYRLRTATQFKKFLFRQKHCMSDLKISDTDL